MRDCALESFEQLMTKTMRRLMQPSHRTLNNLFCKISFYIMKLTAVGAAIRDVDLIRPGLSQDEFR